VKNRGIRVNEGSKAVTSDGKFYLIALLKPFVSRVSFAGAGIQTTEVFFVWTLAVLISFLFYL
jgi:hypothetical protein